MEHYYIDSKGQKKEVKGIDWAVRKERRVPIGSIIVRRLATKEGLLELYFTDGVQYFSRWESHSVLAEWLRTHETWFGAPIEWWLADKQMTVKGFLSVNGT